MRGKKIFVVAVLKGRSSRRSNQSDGLRFRERCIVERVTVFIAVTAFYAVLIMSMC